MDDGNSDERLLIIDDDRGLLRLVEKSLQREGYETFGATSGKEAIDWLTGNRPGLILLDLKLHDIEGKELINHLDAIGRRTPFIIMTGQGDERVAVDMMQRGALDYLVKDIDFIQFLPEVVRRSLVRVRQERSLVDAEAALRKELQFKATLLKTTAALIVVLDRDASIVLCNDAFESVTGCRLEDIRGTRFMERFLFEEEVEEVKRIFAELLNGGESGAHVNYLRNRDGDHRLVSWSNNVILDDEERVELVIGTGLDITEQRHLQRQVLEAADREQRRIGYDLHDGIGQRLTALELFTHGLLGEINSRAPGLAGSVKKLSQELRSVIRETRELSHGLSPIPQGGDGLVTALETLALSIGKLSRVDCEFSCDPPVLIDDIDAATHLYRITQEAVNNALKHGRAKKIWIALSDRGNGWELSVRDNGRGFTLEEARHNGIGLRAMKHRAELIGAVLEIDSAPRKGTRIACKLGKGI